MHPAYSVIFFTTASGAGFGLLALIGLLAGVGALPLGPIAGAIGFALAFALIVGGLMSSAAHLGRRERAWRAFSQWRSSWLSREAVLASLTFVPAAPLALVWLVGIRSVAVLAPLGLAAAALALATVVATAMIYASLKPVAQWHSPLTAPAYLLFALTSGAVLLNALLQAGAAGAGAASLAAPVAAVLFCLAALALKREVWSRNDRSGVAGSGFAATVNEATGIGEGRVRSIEWPHTEANYLLKEMGFRVARKHAERLRIIAASLAFVAPALLLLLACLVPAPLRLALSLLAVPVQLAGLLVERWLFFAEAKHTVSLYYGLA